MVRVRLTGPDRMVPVWRITASEVRAYHAPAHVEGCWCTALSEAEFVEEAAVRYGHAAGVPVSRDGAGLEVVGHAVTGAGIGGRVSSRDLIAAFKPLHQAFIAV